MVTRAKRFGLNDYFGAGQTAYPWLVLDRLSARPYSAWSFARRMTRRWNGPVGRLYRTSDGVEADVYGRGRLGLVDPWAIRAWNGWNKIRNSVFEHAGGTAPSNFTANDTGGAAIASTLFPGETAWSFNAVGDRPFLVQVNIPVKAGYTYSLSFEVESVTGGATATNMIGSQSSPAGTTSDFPACTANPSGTSTGVVQVGRLVRRYGVIADGTIAIRLGLGVNFAITATAVISRPQFENYPTPTDYEPRTSAQLGAGDSLWQKLYDQTGAGRHFEQSSNLIMPYACVGGMPVTENGIQSAEFVAADARRMAVPSSQSLYNFLHTTGGSVNCLSRTNNTTAIKILLASRRSSVRAGVYLYRGSGEQFAMSSGRQNVAGVATDGSTSVVISGTSGLTNRSCVALFDADNSTAAERAKLYIDSTLDPTTNIETATPFVENSEGLLTLGATSNGGVPHDGTITELAVWDSLIGSGDRGTLWSDASSLWGL